MKYVYILLLICNNSFAQEPKADFEILNCKPIKANFLWAAKTELTNIQYLEYLYYTKKNNGMEAHDKMLPDTAVWRNNLGNVEPYVNYYFRHLAYSHYPLVGITKEQAESYCEWLEMILNDKFSNDPKHPVQKINVRLPTEAEWELAARGGNPNAIFPWQGEEMRRTDKKFKGQIKANYVRGRGDYIGIAGSLNDNADITAPVKSYWPNAYGLYNMSGNVAEMVSEDGKTKGGSWGSRAPFLEIDGKDEFADFKEASSKIGFRYFIEVVDFKVVKPKKEIELTAKLIENMLTEIPANNSFLISKYEVSNQLYNLFLKSNSNQQYACDNSLWEREMDYPSIIENTYTSHPDYRNHPVVNITKEGAQAFCTWLSEEYSRFPKRKYENYTFRLPKEKEWELAARGGLKASPYPWGGPYIRNAKGCMLCNYRPAKDRWILDTENTYLISGISESELREAAAQDGLLITGPVNSYHPNDYGAYCMSGNVAEMIVDSNITKGGSWGSNHPYYLQIISSETYEGPSPYIAFRFLAITENDTETR